MSHLTRRLAHQRSNLAFFICNSSSGTNHRSLSSLWAWRRNSAASIQSSLSEIGLRRTLIGAGLLLKSYERLRSADMGRLTRDVITMHLGLPDARYATPAQRANFYDTLLERLRPLPGVARRVLHRLSPGRDMRRIAPSASWSIRPCRKAVVFLP